MIVPKHEKHIAELEKAKRNIKVADYMLNITYKFVDDPKLFRTITEDIFLAVGEALNALLLFERMYKRIPPFNETFDSKYYFYETKISKRYQLSPIYLKMMKEIREIVIFSRKESEMEFSKGREYIMYNKDFRIKKIDIKKTKELVALCKQFVADVEGIISKTNQSTTNFATNSKR